MKWNTSWQKLRDKRIWGKTQTKCLKDIMNLLQCRYPTKRKMNVTKTWIKRLVYQVIWGSTKDKYKSTLTCIMHKALSSSTKQVQNRLLMPPKTISCLNSNKCMLIWRRNWVRINSNKYSSSTRRWSKTESNKPKQVIQLHLLSWEEAASSSTNNLQ